MTIPLSRTIKERTCRTVDPVDMITSREVSTRVLLPSNGTDERIEVQEGFAVTGRAIAPDSLLHICPFCGYVVHQEDTFTCIYCQSIGCKTHADQIQPIDPSVSISSKPGGIAPSGQPLQALGVCKPCAKRAFRQALLWFPLTFFMKPLLAIFAPPPPSSPLKGGPGSTARLVPILFAICSFAFGDPRQGNCGTNESGTNRPRAEEGYITMNYQNNRIPMAQAKLVLEEAHRRGYDRHLGMAESIHVRDLTLSVAAGSVDQRAMLALQEIMAVEDVLSPIPDFFKVFLPEPDPANLAVGELSALFTSSGNEVRHSATEQCAQMRYFGRFGSGKSSCTYGTLRANIANGYSCIIFDSKGSQFDSLITLFPGKVLKLKVGRDRIINPWKYPDLATEVFCKGYGRYDSQVVMSLGVHSLRNPPPGKSAEIVTFSKLITLIPKVHTPPGFPDIRPDLRQSLLAVAMEVFNSPVFRSIDCEFGLDIAALIKNGISVIVDSSEIAGGDVESWLITALLFNAREDIRNDPILSSKGGQQLLICVDEASNIGATSRCYTRGLHPFQYIVSLCRGSGVAVLLCYHTPSTMPELLQTGQIMVCASLVNGPDVQAIKKAMFLSEEQAQALTQLPVGHGVMLIAGRCPLPFAVRWNDFPAIPAPMPVDIAQNNSLILALLPAITEDPCRLELLFKPSVSAPTISPATPFDRDLLHLLEHIDKNPCLNVTERCEAITFPSGTRMTYKQLRPILDDLLKRKDADFIKVQMSVKGLPGEYWYLTPGTRTRLYGSSGAKRGGTGPAHAIVQNLVHRILANRGIPSVMEAKL